MPPRRRANFTAETIDQQLQQIHLLDASSSSENLEQLGPIIKQISSSRLQEAYQRTLGTLIENKDAEIEQICQENYQDFTASVSTLLTVRQYTHNLQDKITTLDGSVSSVGKALLAKKKQLLELKSTAANLDEAIDALQSCLSVLDVVHRVGDMIKQGRFWSALRSLDEIQSLAPSSLSQSPFFTYLLSTIPSLRMQVKDAVTASSKSWLLEIRNVSGQVGRLALETMESRSRRWRSRQDKDTILRSSRIGSAVEAASNEGKEVDVLHNDKIDVDCKPLYQCIHIYTALDALEELQKSYHADRKAQSTLILPSKLTLSALPTLMQEIAGFFIIESYVLRTTRNFRSEREVEELWEEAIRRITEGVRDALATEQDYELFIAVKDCLISFAMTMEANGYSIQSLHTAVLALLERYLSIMQARFAARTDEAIKSDDLIPMRFMDSNEKTRIMEEIFLSRSDKTEFLGLGHNHPAPWSTGYHICCREIRYFVADVFAFVDGVLQHHQDVDESTSKALDAVLVKDVCGAYAARCGNTKVLSQIAQGLTNLGYFRSASVEMEATLAQVKSRKGAVIRLLRFPETLDDTLRILLDRITDIIHSKLNDFFELSEYDWAPKMREDEGTASTYLYELVNWLTTVLDSLTLTPPNKDFIYSDAVEYVANSLMNFSLDPSVPFMNENGLANLINDVKFIEEQLTAIGRGTLSSAFLELESTINIVLMDKVQDYLNAATRQKDYPNVKPKRLATILDKVSKYGIDRGKKGDVVERENGERRRKEFEGVSRIYPGEGR